MNQEHSIFNPSPEHHLLRESIKNFVKTKVEPQALKHDRLEKMNVSLLKELGSMGFLGITIQDKNLGGAQMDATASVIVHEELSYSDPGLCLCYLAHSILCAHNISQNGSQDQKKRWLPKLISGEWIGAMAMSEPDIGTDVLSMKTRVQKLKDHYQMNGKKMWITNGVLDDQKTLVDAVLVYAYLEQNNSKEIATFLVEKNFSGFSAGQIIKDKTGMRSSNTAELIFDECLIPVSHRIEGRSRYHMMKNLEIERLTLAAMSLGIAKRALDEMNRYATQRQAFKKPIRSFGQIQRYIAESYAEFQSCRTYIYHIAHQMDFNNQNQRLSSDSAKLIASQVGKKVADRAIQVLGAYGYVGEYHVERLWRDAKLLEIGGGTLEALQKNITKELESIYEI